MLLSTLQQTVAKSGLQLSFQVQGTQVSPQLQQAQTCSIPDLLSDARAQAQKLADAAGMNLGVVLAMSSLTSSNAQASTLVGLKPFFSTAGSSFSPICSLTVKFALSRY